MAGFKHIIDYFDLNKRANAVDLDRIKKLEDALIEERAKQFQIEGSCHRTSYEYCELLKGTCDGYPHMWDAQLQKEGLI
jgi:hypothetical protein